MRTGIRAAIVLLSVAAAGAEENPERLLHGKWKLDVKLSADTQEGYRDSTPEQRESLARKIAAATPDATFEFTQGKYTFGWTGKPAEKGTYRVNGVAVKRVLLATVPEGADADDDEAIDQIDIQFESADVMHLVHNDIPYTLALRRVK